MDKMIAKKERKARHIFSPLSNRVGSDIFILIRIEQVKMLDEWACLP